MAIERIMEIFQWILGNIMYSIYNLQCVWIAGDMTFFHFGNRPFELYLKNQGLDNFDKNLKMFERYNSLHSRI